MVKKWQGRPKILAAYGKIADEILDEKSTEELRKKLSAGKRVRIVSPGKYMTPRTFYRRWKELREAGFVEKVGSKYRLTRSPPFSNEFAPITFYLMKRFREPIKLVPTKEELAAMTLEERRAIRRAEDEFLKTIWQMRIEERSKWT